MSLVNANQAFSWPARRAQGFPQGGRYHTAAEKQRAKDTRVPTIVNTVHCPSCQVDFALYDTESRKDVRCPRCLQLNCEACGSVYTENHPRNDCSSRRFQK